MCYIVEDALVRRPDHLEYIAVKIMFRGLWFDTIEIDLQHINKFRRSNFNTKDIGYAAKTMLNERFFEAHTTKRYDDESCNYYVIIERFNGIYYKLVICICSDRPESIGIITFYRIKP